MVEAVVVAVELDIVAQGLLLVLPVVAVAVFDLVVLLALVAVVVLVVLCQFVFGALRFVPFLRRNVLSTHPACQ